MGAEDLKQVRAAFAREIQQLGNIRSENLIAGLAAVPREDFMGPGPWKVVRAKEMAAGYQLTPDAHPRHLYENVLVALDAERRLNNGEPLGLMLFLDSLSLQPGERFLHIGCGVGYYTAVAAHALGPTGAVTAVEVDPALAARAESNLKPYPSVRCIAGDGSHQRYGEFDAIFVNAGCTRPEAAWLDQLAIGGRLLLPLTVALPSMPGIGAGSMLLVTRTGEGYAARFTSPVGIFHCEGARSAEGEAALGRAFAGGNQPSVQSLRRDAHAPGPDCWLHGEGFCLQSNALLRRAERKEIAVGAGILARYLGRYQLTPNMVLQVTVREGGLSVKIAEHPTVPIYPESETGFFYKGLDAQIRFVTDASGAVTGLVFHNQGQELPAPRVG
ncbi:MAG TPA: DUF3471 domain-containing protein [Steroidobacteraceae bacterium]|nr:DUF3471 domain-containing protein [Steroidobacteraceae bacterium]